jgi:hypothetical protein
MSCNLRLFLVYQRLNPVTASEVTTKTQKIMSEENDTITPDGKAVDSDALFVSVLCVFNEPREPVRTLVKPNFPSFFKGRRKEYQSGGKSYLKIVREFIQYCVSRKKDFSDFRYKKFGALSTSKFRNNDTRSRECISARIYAHELHSNITGSGADIYSWKLSSIFNFQPRCGIEFFTNINNRLHNEFWWKGEECTP